MLLLLVAGRRARPADAFAEALRIVGLVLIGLGDAEGVRALFGEMGEDIR